MPTTRTSEGRPGCPDRPCCACSCCPWRSPPEALVTQSQSTDAPADSCILEVSVISRVFVPIVGSGLSASSTSSTDFCLSACPSTYSQRLGGPGSGPARCHPLLNFTSPSTHLKCLSPDLAPYPVANKGVQAPCLASASHGVPCPFDTCSTNNRHASRKEFTSYAMESGATHPPSSTFAVSTTLAA